MKTPLILLLSFAGLFATAQRRESPDLFVVPQTSMVTVAEPYVWQGDKNPLLVDTLVCKDSLLCQILFRSIKADSTTIEGRVLYASLMYEIRIDSLSSNLAQIRCYYPYFRPSDFYEYTRNHLAGEYDTRTCKNPLFGYTVVRGVPLLISGNAAGCYFEKRGTIRMSNPYPKNAVIVHDESDPFVFSSDDWENDGIYLYQNGVLEDYSSYFDRYNLQN